MCACVCVCVCMCVCVCVFVCARWRLSAGGFTKNDMYAMWYIGVRVWVCVHGSMGRYEQEETVESVVL